jgi:hypothetical protein
MRHFVIGSLSDFRREVLSPAEFFNHQITRFPRLSVSVWLVSTRCGRCASNVRPSAWTVSGRARWLFFPVWPYAGCPSI